MKLIGIVTIVVGALYLFKPDIFRRGIWMKTSLAMRYLSPEAYRKYIRVIGAVWVLLGIYLYLR
jgi:hypothetical protein